MAWRQRDDRPLSEPMMVRLPTHICVTRPQLVSWITSMWDPCVWNDMDLNLFSDVTCPYEITFHRERSDIVWDVLFVMQSFQSTNGFCSSEVQLIFTYTKQDKPKALKNLSIINAGTSQLTCARVLYSLLQLVRDQWLDKCISRNMHTVCTVAQFKFGYGLVISFHPYNRYSE